MRPNVAIGLILLCGVLLALSRTSWIARDPPWVTDRSCHNPFRDGARSVSALLSIDVAASNEEWPLVRSLLRSFAQSEGLSSRFLDHSSDGVVMTLEVSLCREPGLIVFVNEQRWASQGYRSPIGRGVGVAIYGTVPAAEWQALAARLVARLDDGWPGAVTILDGGGTVVARPAYLERPR
jgi:hypothetical protein